MPIRPELRWFYPIDWPQISAAIRFGRAEGRCERCVRPHGRTIRQLADGRWYDEAGGLWRDDRGREAAWPDIVDYVRVRTWRVVLAAAHLDHDPGNCRPKNLMALCQRCHMIHGRAEHLRRRRVTYLLRRAMGDLFAGPYAIAPFARVPLPRDLECAGPDRSRGQRVSAIGASIQGQSIAEARPWTPCPESPNLSAGVRG